MSFFQINYRTANKFSEHDNRHAFQDHGVYFGNVSMILHRLKKTVVKNLTKTMQETN